MSSRAGSVVTPLIFAAMALYCWVQWYRTAEFAAALKADPVVAEAMIMELTHHSGSHNRYGGFPDRYKVIARFDVQGGDRLSASTGVSEKLFRSLAVGDYVTLKYARSDPTVIEIEPGTLAESAKLYLVGASLLSALLALGAVMVAAYRSVMAQASSPKGG